MNDNSSPKILFVINKGSGANNTGWQDIISNYFTGENFRPEYFFLEQGQDMQVLKKYVDDFAADKVIAVGGDGTVTLVAKIIAGSKAALGILPAGSANGMAKELGIPETPDAALSIIEKGKISLCDAIEINGTGICLHLADIGLNAQLIKYFDEGNLRGKLGYAKVLLKTLWRSQRMAVNLQAENINMQTKAYMVILANASKYGTGSVVNPDGKIDDGKFEVVIVRKLSFVEIIKTFLSPRSLDPKKIETIQVTSIDIKTKRKIHFQIDGEYMGKATDISAKLLPGYINIIKPA